MNKRAMNVWMGAALAIGLAGEVAPAQTASKDDPKNQPTPAAAPIPATPPKRVRAARKSVVDLDAMAKDRRPGQVMPGDPAPMGGTATKPTEENAAPMAAGGANVEKPVAHAPAAAANAAGAETNAGGAAGVKPIKLPDTAPYIKPVLKPSAETGARPEVLSGSMPTPAPEAVPASASTTPAAPMAEVKASEAPAAPVVEKIEPKPAEKMIERPQVAGVTLVDGVVLTQVPMALSTGGASVRVESIAGNPAGVQWRVGDGAWTTPSAGQTADGKVEVRAGLDAQLVVVVDGMAQLQVSRLGRATIERCVEPRAASSVSVNIMRGAVEIRPVGAAATAAAQMFARVRTPDQSFGLTGPLRVEYDAFTGTRRRVVN